MSVTPVFAGRRRLAVYGLLLAAGAAPFLGVACSGAATSGSGGSGGSGGETASSTSSGKGGEGGNLFNTDAGPQSGIVVSPANPTLKVELPLQGMTVPFKCLDAKTMMPVASPAWSLDQPTIGTIDATGLFTPSGNGAGPVKVTCKANGDTADTKLTVLIHALDNPGNVPPADITILQGPPGQGDASWQFLYPYDQTVFPRGILAPEIHLSSGASQGNEYYVHIVTPSFEYEGFFNANPSSTQLQMTQAMWDALTLSAGGQTVEVQVSKLVNGVKFGPIVRKWVLAPGRLHGTIYYNTYNSPLAQNTGAMMRIKGNSTSPEVLVGNCSVCHSISSDGSTAAAANHNGGPSGIYDLTGGNVNPPLVYTVDEIAAFAGLYPKGGAVWVTDATPSWGSMPGMWGGYTSSLYTRTGTLIPNSGIEGYFAMSPIFSHDGTKIAFLDRSSANATALAIMDYDAVTQKFSNYQMLAAGVNSRINSWPAFTPDNKWVVFQSGDQPDLATWGGNMGSIFAVEVATKQVVRLDTLNADAYAPGGQRDLDLNYEPTIAPIASGGYFWVMFTSRRTWGNRLTGSRDQTKRLWVSAFDINAAAPADGSHPAFYIAGQELNSGNSRGFWALDPCKADGQDCMSGDECCNGFCEPDPNNMNNFTCHPPMGGCSQEFDHCTKDADCCDSSLQCIGGVCTYVPPK
jgi:hypothetical protein